MISSYTTIVLMGYFVFFSLQYLCTVYGHGFSAYTNNFGEINSNNRDIFAIVIVHVL